MINPTRQAAAYRRFLYLFPAEHRARHGTEQLRLFTDLVTAGHPPARLWVAAIGDLIRVLVHTPTGPRLAYIATLSLYPASALNAVAGITLAAVALLTTAIPAWVAIPATALIAQGTYTLTWLTGSVPLSQRRTDLLFTVGELAALLIGATGIVTAVITQTGASDPEYGPPTMLTLVATHAIIGLIASHTHRRTATS